MSWIAATDPLALLAIQAGQVNTPSKETGASGGRQLDTHQRAVELGEPVPIVFGLRRNGKGGVLVSPGATEARFENDTTNAVTAYYHLVVSEGQVDSIAVKDVFQRSCRRGSHTQTYNRRAGSWTPGNFIVARAGYTMPECPYYCGSVGTYPGMSTLSFKVTIPDGFDQWNRQVHLFIRGGMRVTRLVDGVTGPSDNFADLVKWMLTSTYRVPAALIDTTALTATATFLEANGFTCNCWITESRNYADLLAQWAPYFLLCESNSNGKRGLRPVLPVNSDGTIKTTAITPSYTFTEDTILPGTLEVAYTSLADRQLFVPQMTWRQQLNDDAGIIRTAEVRYSGKTAYGPYESHDLSAFCTSEDHAVKVGAYILAKRAYTTHTARFTARPEAHNTLINTGDIVRVKLQRQAAGISTAAHDYLYQVERVTKTLAGDVAYECTHFPVDSTGCSLVAKDVAAAVGSGILLTSNKTGVGCDVNSSTDNTVPAEQYTSGTVPYPTTEIPLSTTGLYDPAISNPTTPGGSGGLPANVTQSGDQLTYTPTCAGAYIDWYLVNDATGVRTQVSGGVAQKFIITSAALAAGVSVLGIGRCPDGSTSETGNFKAPPIVGFTGFTTGGYYLYLEIVDQDNSSMGPLPAPDGNAKFQATGINVGVCIAADRNQLGIYTIGNTYNLASVPGNYPVTVSNVRKQLPPHPEYGNPDGSLVRVDLSQAL